MLNSAPICHNLQFSEHFTQSPEKLAKQGIPGQIKKKQKYDKSTFHLPRQNPYFCLKRFKIKDFEK